MVTVTAALWKLHVVDTTTQLALPMCSYQTTCIKASALTNIELKYTLLVIVLKTTLIKYVSTLIKHISSKEVQRTLILEF